MAHHCVNVTYRASHPYENHRSVSNYTCRIQRGFKEMNGRVIEEQRGQRKCGVSNQKHIKY